MIFISFLFVLISLYLWLLARRIVCTFVWIYMRPHDHTWTELLYVFLISSYEVLLILRHLWWLHSQNTGMGQTLIFCLIKLCFIRLEFMELIVSAHFNNVDSLKHNLGFARLCTCVLVLELTALPQCTFSYCTHYVWKRCKLLCVRLICWIQKCIGFLLKVHNGVLVIAAGFMGCGNPLSLIYI